MKKPARIPVRFPLLAVFCLAGIAILSISFLATRFTEARLLEDSIADRAASTKKLFEHELETVNGLQVSILEKLSSDKQIIEAFETRERESLSHWASAPFNDLNARFNITHLYFITPALEVFHRAHHPERYGDQIHRFTALTSQKAGRISWGLELGRFGTLTLRTVMPWRVEGKLLGYLEVGQEIDIIVQNLMEILDHDLIVTVKKDLLDEKDWNEGKSFRVSSGQWNDAEAFLVAGSTLNAISSDILEIINQHESANTAESFSVLSEQVTFLPIKDASTKEIGELVVIADMHTAHHRFLDGLFFGSALSVTVGIIGFLIFWAFATKIEKALYEAQSELEKLVAKKSTQYEEEAAKVEYQSKYDGLTGLPNRSYALSELRICLNGLTQNQGNLALMQVNIDGLSKVNDVYGHKKGDDALNTIAHRIRAAVPELNMVARIESDEFLIIISDIPTSAIAEIYAQQILEDCARPLLLDQEDKQEIALSVRLGITLAPNDGDDEYVLLKNAHAATAWAKTKGGNTYCYFTPELETLSATTHKIENHLRNAVVHDELALHYQPIIDLRTGQIAGAEALLRWTNKELGAIAPDSFIPIAEANGMIDPISKWVLSRAIHDLSIMLADTHSEFKLAINLSANQFTNPSISEEISSLLDQHKLPAKSIKLELTEGMLMADKTMGTEMITALKLEGLECSLDDFGTGYSSLAYLKDFPISTLKIDKSFISDMKSQTQDKALVHAIITMAHGLSLPIIAEGIETKEQCEILSEWGCQYGQGYLFSKPVALDAFLELLRENQRSSGDVKSA